MIRTAHGHPVRGQAGVTLQKLGRDTAQAQAVQAALDSKLGDYLCRVFGEKITFCCKHGGPFVLCFIPVTLQTWNSVLR